MAKVISGQAAERWADSVTPKIGTYVELDADRILSWSLDELDRWIEYVLPHAVVVVTRLTVEVKSGGQDGA